jgi:uncharacterized protein YqeY
MTQIKQLQDDLKSALFAKDELKVSTLRMLLADVKNYSIEKQKEVDESDLTTLLDRQVKRHRESIEGFEKGGRVEMAEKEKKELEILRSYLPEQLSEEAVTAEVEKALASTGATSISEMGKVMGALGHLKGKADLGLVSQKVKEKLS